MIFGPYATIPTGRGRNGTGPDIEGSDQDNKTRLSNTFTLHGSKEIPMTKFMPSGLMALLAAGLALHGVVEASNHSTLGSSSVGSSTKNGKSVSVVVTTKKGNVTGLPS